MALTVFKDALTLRFELVFIFSLYEGANTVSLTKGTGKRQSVLNND